MNGLAMFFYIYLLLGLLFGLYFIARGANKLDETINNSSRWMRALLLPGAVALWPYLLIKLQNK